MMIDVPLICGETIEVRRFRPYEMDDVKIDDPGPYIVRTVKPGGAIEEWEYQFDDDPPTMPDVPEDEVLPESREEAEWVAYKRYRAALSHQEQRNRIYEEYAHEVNKRILSDLVKPEDLDKIQIPDLDALRQATILGEVGMEDIESALADVFPSRVLWSPDYYISQFQTGQERADQIDLGAILGIADARSLQDEFTRLVRSAGEGESDNDSRSYASSVERGD